MAKAETTICPGSGQTHHATWAPEPAPGPGVSQMAVGREYRGAGICTGCSGGILFTLGTAFVGEDELIYGVLRVHRKDAR